MRTFLATIVVLFATGCVIWFANHLTHFGTPPDPNDPRQAGILAPDVLKRNLAVDSDVLQERVRKREISDEKAKELMAKDAEEKLNQVDLKRIPPAKAWEYAEEFITAKRWDDAKNALEVAIKVAKDEDRRVNDRLRLARVLAELGDVKSAIPMARSTFDTNNTSAAPILPATLLEIVPAAEGKGDDAGLAALLEDAIKCEQRTIVDPNTEPGKAFLLARPFHIRNAYRKEIELYESAKLPDKAKAAQAESDKVLNEQAGA